MKAQKVRDKTEVKAADQRGNLPAELSRVN